VSTDYSQSHTAPKLRLRPLVKDDFPLLVDWINAPHVAPWWDEPADIDLVKEKYQGRLAKYALTSVYIAELNHQPIGFIQCYRHADYPDWDKVVGIEKAAQMQALLVFTVYVVFNTYF